MKTVKCPNCGANMNLNDTKCEFCDSTFIKETNNSHIETHINNYNNTTVKIPKRRPVVRVSVVIILCFISVFFAIFYIIVVKHEQKKWDNTYTY